MSFKTVDLSKSYQQSPKVTLFLCFWFLQLFAAFVRACVAAFCNSASPQNSARHMWCMRHVQHTYNTLWYIVLRSVVPIYCTGLSCRPVAPIGGHNPSATTISPVLLSIKIVKIMFLLPNWIYLFVDTPHSTDLTRLALFHPDHLTLTQNIMGRVI